MWSCLVFIAGPRFYTVSLLLRMGDFGSSDHLVSELFVVGCSGSRDGLNPTPLPIHLHSSLPFLNAGITNIPLCKGDVFLFAYGRLTIWVTDLLSSVALTNRGEKKTLTFWMSVFVFALKYGLFMPIEWAGLCICVFNTERGSVGSGHAWIVAVFLHCPESTTICSPASEAPVSAVTYKGGWPPVVFHCAGLLRG